LAFKQSRTCCSVRHGVLGVGAEQLEEIGARGRIAQQPTPRGACRDEQQVVVVGVAADGRVEGVDATRVLVADVARGHHAKARACVFRQGAKALPARLVRCAVRFVDRGQQDDDVVVARRRQRLRAAWAIARGQKASTAHARLRVAIDDEVAGASGKRRRHRGQREGDVGGLRVVAEVAKLAVADEQHRLRAGGDFAFAFAFTFAL
jgi:hypothetical protein